MADITMPQLGETVTEGTITKWRKQVGEEVKEDDVLFEVSTDKVDSEVPSPVSGVLSQVLANEGDTVAVGTVIAVVDAGASGSDPVKPVETLAAEPAPTGSDPVTPPPPPPPARPPVVETPPPPPVSNGVSTNGSSNGTSFDNAGKVLSPVVRKLLAENNLNPAELKGTGAGGRITRRDVETVVAQRQGGSLSPQPQAPAVDQGPTLPPTEAQPVAPPQQGRTLQPRPAPIAAPVASHGDTIIPFTNIRRRTAEHMIRSKATSAHTLVVLDIDYLNVDKVRIPNKAKFKAEEGVNLTYLPFIARAVCDALREFPNLNASVGNEELIIHGDINLGFAVDMGFQGLIVPVVRQSDGKRLRALTREIADLAKRARDKQLGTDEIANGTFTITNAGGYGTVVTYPVINQPQVAILSTDGIKKRPVVIELPDGTDAIAVHPVGNLALAWDHRAVDGAYAAAFMARVKEILETRNWAEEI